MTRWKPDGRERLQRAAVDLFRERGYEAVTVSDIADRAGLTKRSFFNHFADKREVLFAGAADFHEEVLRCLRDTDPTLTVFEAGVDALGRAGRTLTEFAPYIPMRQKLIDSSLELQERDLIKLSSLSAAMADELVKRGEGARRAHLGTEAAVTAFSAAYEDWGRTPDADFAALIRSVAADLLLAILGDEVRHDATGPATTGPTA